jgi:putative SOS response-associated peptidase YedK
MCGRYAIECEEENIFLKEILEEIGRRYADNPILSQMKTCEIFPTETVPALALEKSKATPVLMNWGFPRTGPGGVVINARAETALQKNMFRTSVLSRRCVVPSTGFYEWRRDPNAKKKDKYLLRPPAEPLLYMAGLYNLFPYGGEGRMPGFVILTTQANAWVSPIHSRMPLILSWEESVNWLGDGAFAAELLSRPCPAELTVCPQ